MDWIPVKINWTTGEFKNKMPESRQRILITYRGTVLQDVNYKDDADYYLQSGIEWEEVTAWMPEPGPYRG